MKKVLIPIFVVVLVFLMLSISASATKFNDIPASNHWVMESFNILNNAGLLKGYPDGHFRGQEKASRFEMVELTARVLKFMEEKVDLLLDEKKYLTQDEVEALLADYLNEQAKPDEVYEAIKTLEKEFATELAELNPKVTTLEADVAALQKANQEAMEEAKNAKLLAIIGIVLGLAGLISSLL